MPPYEICTLITFDEKYRHEAVHGNLLDRRNILPSSSPVKYYELQSDISSEDGGSVFLLNVVTHLQVHTASTQKTPMDSFTP
jgi:hypothetical protein